MAGEGRGARPGRGRSLGKTADRGRCEGARGAVPGTPACCACCRHCLKTFHFHLRTGSLPCNLHLCSYPYTPRPWLPGQPRRGTSAAVETRVAGVWRSRGGWFPLGRHGGTGPYAPNTWVNWEGPDPQPRPAFPQGPHGQYSIPARPCSGLLGPCGAGADG